jgi:uncharacterized protein (DUF169 family)
MEKMWRKELAELVEVLGLKNKPVAVTFTNDVEVKEEHRRISFCRALKLAAAGESVFIDEENSACPGGSWHCGLSEPPSGDARRGIQWFLTRGEKLTSSIVSFHRMQALTSPPPTGLSDCILMGPIEEAELRPDLVVFLCNGEQACRLITLDQYWDGIPPRVEMAGSLCHAAIAYPVVTGLTNVTFGDWTARRQQGYSADAVFVSIPYERVHNLVAAVPECSAGSAEPDIPEEFLSSMQEE